MNRVFCSSCGGVFVNLHGYSHCNKHEGKTDFDDVLYYQKREDGIYVFNDVVFSWTKFEGNPDDLLIAGVRKLQ